MDEVKISTIKFKRLGPEVCRPEKKSEIAAGYDISAVESKIIWPWKCEVISTQIMLAIPHGAYGRIAPRSELTLKGIDVTAGIIDSDYWEEVKVLLVNHSDVQFEVKTGDCIAQLIIKKISLDKLNEENHLDETKRGDQGFGSMGVAETPKISILKRPKNQSAKVAESPREILPEKVDKQSWQGWMNTVDPWTSQWIKRVVDSKDKEQAIKHMRSFVHKSRQEQVTPRLIWQLREISELKAQFVLHELQQKPRFVQCNSQSDNPFEIKATLETPLGETLNVIILLDFGCTGTTITKRFAKEKGLKIYKLPVPISVYNADGSINSAGSIQEFAIVEMRIRDHSEQIAMAMSNLSTHPIFLGYDWLRKHNPQINWKAKTLQFMCENEHTPGLMNPEINDEEVEPKQLFMINYEYFRNLSTNIAIAAGESKQTKIFEEIVPKAYHEYKDVFTKETFDELLLHRPRDHAIELLPGNHKVDCKTYNLTTAKQKELDNFLEENLSTGHIQPSKSQFTSAFFFVKKKDGKLYPIQDYRKLNDITVKNRYPLLLISKLIDKLKNAKCYTKLNIRWGYNNIRMKEGDKWKAAFQTNRGLFEPLVMFFGLCNSPTTF